MAYSYMIIYVIGGLIYNGRDNRNYCNGVLHVNDSYLLIAASAATPAGSKKLVSYIIMHIIILCDCMALQKPSTHTHPIL